MGEAEDLMKKGKKLKNQILPLEIIGDFVFETGKRVDLPLYQLFLQPIARYLTQGLKHQNKFPQN